MKTENRATALRDTISTTDGTSFGFELGVVGAVEMVESDLITERLG